MVPLYIRKGRAFSPGETVFISMQLLLYLFMLHILNVHCEICISKEIIVDSLNRH